MQLLLIVLFLSVYLNKKQFILFINVVKKNILFTSMNRNNLVAESKQNLYFSCIRLEKTTTSVISATSEPSNTYFSEYENESNVCHIKSKRKSAPRKSLKSETKLYVQQKTTLVNVLGENKRIKLKILKNMKFLYKAVLRIIPKDSFTRLVREVLFDNVNRADISRFSSTALHAIQEASEIYLIYLNFLSAVCSHEFNSQEVTVKPIDIILSDLEKNR